MQYDLIARYYAKGSRISCWQLRQQNARPVLDMSASATDRG